ncbi:MAG: SDR family NAD(P)-dependent oxidoreductase [Roseiarcus sp.]|jgi:NAD(P)-dependent dehydrogenase (short-subunit alcohol dehydrogenase family)
MQGKTVVATGATSGIGAIAVVELARMGARILFIARDARRADATLAKLEAVAPGRGHRAHIADLSLVAETRRVGGEIAAGEARVDVLINNAGAIFSDRRLTAEGLEMTFALNHMAYFTLTKALRERLVGSAPARVVSTASAAHYGAKLDFDDLQCERGYSAWRAYNRSKLANILFTRELAKRLTGTGVTANCLHPGFVASRFGDEAGGWTARLFPFVKRFGISPAQGADTIVYLASSPDVAAVSGEYFAKRRIKTPSGAARDDQAAARLWEMREAITSKIAFAPPK